MNLKLSVDEVLGKVKKPQCHEREFGVFVRSILSTLQSGVPGAMVEIGSNKGKSLACLLQVMQLAEDIRQVFSVDPYGNAEKYVPHRIEKFSGDIPVEHIRLPSQDPKALERVNMPIAWLFIDGCHCFDCTWVDIDSWVPKVIHSGTVVFHDFCPRTNYRKRDYCAAADAKRRWGVWPAFQIAKAARELEKVEQSVRHTPGMAVFRKVT